MTALAAPYLLLRRDGEARMSRAEPLALDIGVRRADMSRTIAERNFTLAFQSVVRMGDLRLVGREALLRLRPGARAQSTRAFVDMAQEWGLSAALDEAVLDTALASLGRGGETPVSVNIAARSLRDPVFFARLLGRVAGKGAQIAVEIAGVAEFADVPATVAAAAALRSADVRVALDDFRSDEAVLACLRAARFDDVKLAGAVLGEAVAGEHGRRLLAALTKLAEAAGARVMAKLVETEPQAALLHALGVRYGQGWLFGAPQTQAAERQRILEPA